MLQIKLNGTDVSVPSDCNKIDYLVKSFKYQEKNIAVAVNNTVIRRNRWGEFTIKDGDSIRFLQITYGG